ncbi:purine-cytosine permease family protein [Rhodococcus sp. NPDC060176]|uniref:purine-cytosine permease family protein n=1 Tax=Rhodococcus sp. NPDC060176 TaxID=3347062 RepID=UPI0036511B21
MLDSESPTGLNAHVEAGNTGIERRSIDWIPNSERHGKVSSLGGIWFVGNVNLTSMATGVTAFTFGAGLFWTSVAAVLGILFGTFFMAFHSAQGPHLGLPQLVQSRAQFGFRGAAITVWVAALINYIAYNTSDALLSGAALQELVHLPANIGYPVVAAISTVVALYGYRWIHKVNAWLTVPMIIVMVLITVACLSNVNMSWSLLSPTPFRLAPFMSVFIIMAGYQIAWAPYVSDYSRYLPASTGILPTFNWTFWPSAISGVWVLGIGVVIGSVAPNVDPVQALVSATQSLGPILSWICVAGLVMGLFSVMVLNQYGGSMSMISIVDSFRPVESSRRIRAFTLAAMFIIVWTASQFIGIERFNSFYSNAIVFLTYAFIPWTAINLVDYFWVRRGQYSIRELFRPTGIYGMWGWRGTTAYAVGIIAMIPFMVTTPFVGFAASRLGSVDYSILLGLPVSAVVYLILARSLDLKAERSIVAAEGLIANVETNDPRVSDA